MLRMATGLLCIYGLTPIVLSQEIIKKPEVFPLEAHRFCFGEFHPHSIVAGGLSEVL